MKEQDETWRNPELLYNTVNERKNFVLKQNTTLVRIRAQEKPCATSQHSGWNSKMGTGGTLYYFTTQWVE